MGSTTLWVTVPPRRARLISIVHEMLLVSPIDLTHIGACSERELQYGFGFHDARSQFCFMALLTLYRRPVTGHDVWPYADNTDVFLKPLGV